MPFRESLREMKRRRDFRVAAVYAVVGWLIIQVADTTFGAHRRDSPLP